MSSASLREDAAVCIGTDRRVFVQPRRLSFPKKSADFHKVELNAAW